MFWFIVLTSWAIFIWDIFLALRQYRVHKNTEKRPEAVSAIISEEDFTKARLYKIDKHHFNFAHSIYSQIEITIVLVFEIFYHIWVFSGTVIEKLGLSGEIPQSVAFATVLTLVETVLSTPWQLYDTFCVEEKHGFNKQTVAFFFKDKLKKTAVILVIMAPILAAVIYIVQSGGPYFFFYVWLFLSVIIFLLLTVYPEFIAPLFDKYVPLPSSDLRQKIEKLAASVNFPLKKLYVVQGSKRSAHSNAYMYGFWNNKRIVLYDTLLSEEMNAKLKEEYDLKDDKEGDEQKERKLGMCDDEVVAVLGHELGHWALLHTIFNILITEANLLLLLVVFSHFYRIPAVYAAFGFLDSNPTIIGLIVVLQYITAPYNEILSFLMTVLSRRMEFAADHYSVKLGHADQLCSALVKLGKDNLSLPIDDPLYSLCNHSHPPIPERIEAIKKHM